MAKKLMKGNEALGEAAIQAGCRYFFGYPITPQNEIPSYLSRKLPEVGGVYLQAESEVAAINMVYGAAGAGARVLTSSSSPGISLKTEGISYIAGAQLPCVIVNIVRGGPGLGGIQPAQSDYFQATKGGGHGDYRLVVLTPSTVQELVDLTMEAFEIADQYRTPVMILGDGIMGQMMEPVEFNPPKKRELPEKTWATTGCEGREPNVTNSLHMAAEDLENHNLNLLAKYKEIAQNETKYESYETGDADIVLVAYGTTARICKTAIAELRKEGLKVGLIRPITVWPYPDKAFEEVMDTAKEFVCIEMSTGQMVEDVRLAVNGRKPVHFYGRTGGVIPSPQEVADKIREIAGGVK
ncbi:3-methyl-2-oxobutanoate dehydrogenase subunit VorB [Alkalicella caledoniensis]|uniref:3-methyl-2-oxobutanoate dehydrogenase subunit VorB n=1 Tax=Alkalicella caledoniensis TaxID=2731377 RepID=A0A7G9WBX1_ALKCA|nr:3-methyl-2-oxobutanoate dehydrogenase subunit VorB [Alkalicella caledoniensis]QNO16183.1 3-methyl-2-oxobutanoate dehydrogenase subunit VorB [Alkalicella caledoniensis]